MSIVAIYDFSWIIPSGILVILWIIMLVHIRKGNQNKWLFAVVFMLMIGALGSMIEGWTLYELTVLHEVQISHIYWLGIGVALTYGMFSITHFLLAVKYRKMATNVPRLLTGLPEKKETVCDAVVYWLLLSLNIAAPLLLAYS